MSPISLDHVDEGNWPAVQRNTDRLGSAVNPPVPQARVFNSANISTNPSATLTFDSERYDNGGLHSTSSNTNRLTAPITGLYAFGACVQFASNATGYREVDLKLTPISGSGSVVVASTVQQAVNGLVTIVPVSTTYQLVAGDYVEVVAGQGSGGALNVVAAANYSPEFWMYRIGGYVNQGV